MCKEVRIKQKASDVFEVMRSLLVTANCFVPYPPDGGF